MKDLEMQNLVWSCSKLRLSSPSFYAEVRDAIEERWRMMKPVTVAVLGSSLARFGDYPFKER